MANKKVGLVLLCKTENGWKRFPAVFAKNGRLRPQWANVAGELREFPKARYQLRSYAGRKTVWKNAGEDATEALSAWQRSKQVAKVKLAAEDAGIEIVNIHEDRPTLLKRSKAFVDDAKKRNRKVAADAYELTLDHFMESTKKIFLDQIVREDFVDFHERLRKDGYADRTVYNRHMHLVSFFKFCGIDLKEMNVDVPPYDEKRPEIYRKEDIRRFHPQLKEYNFLAFETLLKTGMREQEAMYFEFADIDYGQGKIKIRSKPHYDFYIKDRTERDVPVTADMLELWRAHQEKNPKQKLVIATRNKKPQTKLLLLLKRAVRAANVNCGSCPGCVDGFPEKCSYWYLHRYRGTFCTFLLRSGIDLRTVQEYMGHSDLSSTMRYLSPAEDKAAQATINLIEWM